MGWQPGNGFASFGKWIGYNEAMIMYLLAIGSPTHPVPATRLGRAGRAATRSGLDGARRRPYVKFAPLFGHQYSHCWIDFRGIQDTYMPSKGIDYFENSRRATLAQMCVRPRHAAPRSRELLPPRLQRQPVGLDRQRRSARGSARRLHGARPGNASTDDGTIVADRADQLGAVRAGFRVALHAQHVGTGTPPGSSVLGPVRIRGRVLPRSVEPWVDFAVLGIDQGPIVLMIENYRNNMIWARTMSNADIQRGLSLAGFNRVAGVPPPSPRPGPLLTLSAEPNPVRGTTTLRYRLGSPGHVRLTVFDTSGRRLNTLVDEDRPAGEHSFRVTAVDFRRGSTSIVSMPMARRSSGAWWCSTSFTPPRATAAFP